METNRESVQSQLLLLLSQQPERLASQKLTHDLFTGHYLEVFVAMVDLYLGGHNTNLRAVSLYPKLGEAAANLASQLSSYEDPAISFDYAIKYLRDETKRQAFSELCRTGYDHAHDRKRDIDDSITKIHSAVSSLIYHGGAGSQSGSQFKTINELIEWRNANPGRLMGPSSGWSRLDRVLNGITPRFYLIGARPSVGKSAITGNLIEALCEQEEKCLLFTLEMSADEYRVRMLAAKSGVNTSSYRSSAMEAFEIKQIIKAQKDMKRWKWWINDNPDTSISDIEAVTTAMVAEHGRMAVFVDYLQLVGSDGGSNKVEQLGIISSRLKKLSRRLNIPLLACAQLKRLDSRFIKEQGRTVTPKPKLDDFRESGNLEQDADVAMLIDRDINEEPEKAELIIAKQRAGATGSIPLRYIPSITTFKQQL